jgi:hypothetical protein
MPSNYINRIESKKMKKKKKMNEERKFCSLNLCVKVESTRLMTTKKHVQDSIIQIFALMAAA